MQTTSAQESLEQLCAFVARDLPRLCAACRNERLPLAKLLHHARRRTTHVQVSARLLNSVDSMVLHGCLLEIMRACEPIATMRGQRADWLLTMLPDVAAALMAYPPSPSGYIARIGG